MRRRDGYQGSRRGRRSARARRARERITREGAEAYSRDPERVGITVEELKRILLGEDDDGE